MMLLSLLALSTLPLAILLGYFIHLRRMARRERRQRAELYRRMRNLIEKGWPPPGWREVKPDDRL